MIVTAKLLLSRAENGGFAVGAFNTSTLEVTKAIMEAADELNTPVIIETSEGEADYLGKETFVDIVRNLSERLTIDVAINFDHGKSKQTVTEAMNAGYSAVHFDGSKLERSAYIAAAKEVVLLAHRKGISVEGEFNDIGGSSQLHEQAQVVADLTDPAEAESFVRETKVDIFAGSYGNVHGIYTNPPKLNIELIKEVRQRTGALLSLHGGSGIPEDQIKAAIAAGIRKINVNTELRLAYKEDLQRAAASGEAVPYKFLPEVIEEVKKVVKEKITLFKNV